MERITEKILNWQLGKAALDVVPSDLDQLVRDNFDATILLIASINDTSHYQYEKWVAFEAKVINNVMVSDDLDEDQSRYLKQRLKILSARQS